jgi:hypothetical protein
MHRTEAMMRGHRNRASAILSILLSAAGLSTSAFSMSQEPENPLAAYISISNPVIALAHVEVIDGTGTAPIADQTIIISGGKIHSLGPAAGAQLEAAMLADAASARATVNYWIDEGVTSFKATFGSSPRF